jgi:hypothetical protein
MNERDPPDEPSSQPTGTDGGHETGPDGQETPTRRPMTDGAAQSWDSDATPSSDSLESETDEGEQQFGAVLRAAGFGWLGFACIIFWQIPLGVLVLPIATEWLAEPVAQNVIGTISLGFGTATGVWLYLRWSERDIEFLDVSVPSIGDLGYIGGGTVGLFAALIGISQLLSWLGISSSEHSIVQQSQQNPELLLLMIPLSLLVVGPGEELLYRNVVQKSLYDTFSKGGAIVIASVIFASVHILAYGTTATSITSILTSLGLIFLLSLVLGWVYARRENVVVPAIVHGVFNAGQFLLLYL